MTSGQWGRAKEIFDAALEVPLPERTAYVCHQCADEPGLLTEVQQLLAAAEKVNTNFLKPDWMGGSGLQAAPMSAALSPSEVIAGRFRILRGLGDGGMGRVYEAHDAALNVRVALKTLRPEVARSEEALKRFHREVRIAHRITHPNVCRTFHLDRALVHIGDNGSEPTEILFITMELLEGETLQQVLKREGALPLPRVLHIARGIAEALDAAHHIGIVHRDIKPGNIMLCPARGVGERSERIVITDFGLARLDRSAAGGSDLSSITLPGRAMGTLSYMAPEQIVGSVVTSATDIYGFGLVLYEMVTGCKAFPHSSTYEGAMARLAVPSPAPKALVPHLPACWNDAIVRCLSSDPFERFSWATDVMGQIDGSRADAGRAAARSPWRDAWAKAVRWIS